MSIRFALVVVLALGAGLGVRAETPRYLWAEIGLPSGAVAKLPDRAHELEVATAAWTEGELVLMGAESEDALRAGGTYLYLDGEQFLLGVETGAERITLRGNGEKAELIVWAADGLVPPSEAFFDLMRELGLLDEGITISLTVKELALKLPRVPEGIKLDPTLWALVGHPDWFGAARDFGLERVGLRVRVVAEAATALAEDLEPYVLNSSGSLTELLIPIALLSKLGQDPAVRSVRPPFTPYPAVGG
ncbi:MAG: hypothetical protein BIP78_1531 [Candidatus Bipolaricaulis sibiricus]|uniref:Uncharacterized protein n=1 Tax=Bipolaricaulis sibiricus TaxID=2501609 RepID=A0A410FW34_BIPS1|nr:MAG: hypothetical protein BIP78_1531 [Candidatus Bipolaricaulis sibiricus]